MNRAHHRFDRLGQIELQESSLIEFESIQNRKVRESQGKKALENLQFSVLSDSL